MSDLKPDWFEWYINNRPLEQNTMSSFLEKDGVINSVKIVANSLPSDVDDVRQESEAYLDSIIETCGYDKFAVFISGIDSEIIARYLVKKQLDVELYYTNFWFKDNTESDIIKEIASELDVKYNLIDYDWKIEGHQSILKILTKSLQPCSVKNTHIYSVTQVPEDRYIFMGNRNFEKNATRYLATVSPPEKTNIAYMDTRQFSQRHTLNLLGRDGCSTFWFNDARTTSAMFRDSRTDIQMNGEIENKQIFWDLWGKECLFKQKTHPYKGPNIKYNWETWYPEHWRNRAKAVTMIQRRYLRRKYGNGISVVGNYKNTEKNVNTWVFGDKIDIDQIL